MKLPKSLHTSRWLQPRGHWSPGSGQPGSRKFAPIATEPGDGESNSVQGADEGNLLVA